MMKLVKLPIALFSTTTKVATRKNKPITPSNSVSKSLDFRAEVEEVLDKLFIAIKPLEEINPNFQCQLSNAENSSENTKTLLVATKRGNFKFTPDMGKGILIFQSYITGYHSYQFDYESRLWLSIKPDKHDLRGMVTREFLRHCTGCPQFN
mmetsp:Transcript_7883/g.10910  ORF Transcript_7883/g.10910 Transcript_7883/m.10910 type:complete len:151 (+) Transcript_7883:3-455(+)